MSSIIKVDTIQLADGSTPSVTDLGLSALTSSDMPTGSVIQVVSATYSTLVSSTSTSYIDTGLTANITPSSTSNKILVIVSQTFGIKRNDPYHVGLLAITRNTTVINEVHWDNEYTASLNYKLASPSSITTLDSPSSTSSVTYKTQIRCYHGSNSEVVYANNRGAEATITLMEIAG